VLPAALCHSGAGVGEVVVTWIRRRQLVMCGELVTTKPGSNLATQPKVCQLCKWLQHAVFFPVQLNFIHAGPIGGAV
jgi:hypothetical protein